MNQQQEDYNRERLVAKLGKNVEDAKLANAGLQPTRKQLEMLKESRRLQRLRSGSEVAYKPPQADFVVEERLTDEESAKSVLDKFDELLGLSNETDEESKENLFAKLDFLLDSTTAKMEAEKLKDNNESTD